MEELNSVRKSTCRHTCQGFNRILTLTFFDYVASILLGEMPWSNFLRGPVPPGLLFRDPWCVCLQEASCIDGYLQQATHTSKTNKTSERSKTDETSKSSKTTKQARQYKQDSKTSETSKTSKTNDTSETSATIQARSSKTKETSETRGQQDKQDFFFTCKKLSFQVLGGVHTQLNKLTGNKLECCKEDKLSLILLWKLDTLHSSSTVKSHR